MEKANYFKLGVFVIGAVAALVALLIAFGAGHWFSRGYTMETYFDESVQGLEVGSKVRYRGVVVGDVRKITFTYTRYELDKPLEERRRYVLVEARIRPELMGATLSDEQRRQTEIERGMRVRLAAQGITGQLYLEIDYVEPRTSSVVIDWVPENFYVPSTQSTARQFVDAIEALLDRLQKFDIESVISNVNKLMQSLTTQVEQLHAGEIGTHAKRVLQSIEKAQLDKLGAEAQQLVAELRHSNSELQSTLGNPAWKKFPDDVAATAQQARQILESPGLRASITRLERTTKRLDQLLGGRDTDIGASLENLRQITDNLRDLTENLKQNPGSLLFGPAPAQNPGR